MPAMPFEGCQNNGIQPSSGLTKREHFAAMAMQGLLGSFGVHDVTAYDEIASDAVMAADALPKELEK